MTGSPPRQWIASAPSELGAFMFEAATDLASDLFDTIAISSAEGYPWVIPNTASSSR
ncbi:hypothetical protein I6I68_03715 [Corynebacterium glucuronolyticum]|uniref:hypothetical protein n=1 Tax=Corynebacterium glucuronolyticum TaxID=39791 RepID=UPI00191F1B3C|nr:hypothetical protein [Corynebacterium glucuronolyticum]QQU89086.1 hypothetical protein I6I68_03715 [Corynebacterium glucuronolyticum]